MGFFGNKSDKPESLFEKYTIDRHKKYGEGGYGATFAATEKATGEPLACKLIDMRRMREDAIKKECKILETLTHANVISVKAHGPGVGEQSHIYFIFMELASGGELFDQVIDRGVNAMNEATARGFFCQMIDGIAYCHLAGVAHRDLKLENVLLNAQGQIKVIDFGLSHVYPRSADGTIDRSRRLHDVCGSKSYAAPEVLANRSEGYDGYAADMWSLGVCLFAMLSGFFPLDEATPADWRFPKLADAQARGHRSTTKTIYQWYKRGTDHLSREVLHMLDALLTIDPSKRMTMEQLRQHPWIQGSKFDQGVFNQSMELSGEDGPTYRGFQTGPGAFEDDMYVEDDEMPVYRSMGMPGVEDSAAAPPPAPPAMARQKAQANMLEPLSDPLAL